VLKRDAADKIRHMAARAIGITSRLVFFLCGLISLFTAVPYVIQRGAELPVQSEWVIFVAALSLVGVFSLMLAVLPRSWIGEACKKDREDPQLFSALLKALGSFAAIFYLVAVAAYFTPNRWNLNPQIMLALCPLYLIKMMFDPPPVAIFFLLAPMNAAVYGSLGLAFACVRSALRKRT
jgi:hypothetical protein